MNAPSPEAHLGKASATHQLGEYDEAAEQFRRVLSTTDDALKVRAWFDLGVNEAKAGRLDAAIESFQRSLELVPEDPDARYDLEWALAAKKQQEEQKKDGEKSDDGKSGGDKDQKSAADQKQDESRQDESKQGEQKQDDQKADGSEADARKGEPGKDGAGNQTPQENEQKPGEQPQAGAGEAPRDRQPPKPMNAQKAAAVLDALQGGEKSLQMWRFQKQAEKQKGGDVAQDW